MNRLKLPSKGFGFNKFFSIIELKFRRRGGPSDRDFLKQIEEDRDKIKKIRASVSKNNNFRSYLLIFDKKKDLKIPTIDLCKDREYYIFTNE